MKPTNQKLEENIIVPRGEFVNAISKKTGWSISELETKDLGDIEKKLNIQGRKPNRLWQLKRGKPRNDLYNFVSQYRREKNKELVTKLIES